MKIMSEKTTHFERNNFYFGKLMTARDFTDEQSYLNEKRWLINRLGLGWGVLCGLKVVAHPKDRQQIIVKPGLVIDPYGHEIVVCEEEILDLTSVAEPCPPTESHSYYYDVSIRYEECGINPSSVIFDECDGPQKLCVYNRIREGYRLMVRREKPDLSSPRPSPAKHLGDCEDKCHQFLHQPGADLSHSCHHRPECGDVPLARICYNPETSTGMVIDHSLAHRKLAFSNETLYELLACLRQEVEQSRAARPDRRQHVPLLASTIKGLKFQDGKIATVDKDQGYLGKRPFRLTSDGDYIWVTDREDEQIWLIDRKTNQPIKDEKLALKDKAWGIAYDGHYMWITHHDSSEECGKLTRVNVCTLKTQTITDLPKCETLPPCYQFLETAGTLDSEKLKPFPGEIVLHDGHIYVAHDRKIDGQPDVQGYEQRQRPGDDRHYELSLTRIDPVKGCIIETIDIPIADGRVPWSGIRAMASDGEALWITYHASSQANHKGRVVVRKITRQGNHSVVGKSHRLGGEIPERMVFDGSRLWVSHNDGVSAVSLKTGKEEEMINSRTRHTALAYGGGELLWAALPGGSEAFINWINIFSEEFKQWLELIESDDPFEISDMQFDGTYLYVAYHYAKPGQDKVGVIHRLLP
jgi:hypothetical protein